MREMRRRIDNLSEKAMKFRLTDLAISSFLFGIALFVISRQQVLLGVLNLVHHSNTWEKRDSTVAMLLLAYAFLFFGLGVFCSIRALKFSMLWSYGAGGLRNAPQAL